MKGKRTEKVIRLSITCYNSCPREFQLIKKIMYKKKQGTIYKEDDTKL